VKQCILGHSELTVCEIDLLLQVSRLTSKTSHAVPDGRHDGQLLSIDI